MASDDPTPAADAPRERRGLYRSTKFYDHSEGLSCCFRQWRAVHSHCRLLHGYALAFRFVFATRDLDRHHWCLDFGSLSPVRSWLHDMFDHTLIVAEDDPERAALERLAAAGLADVRVLPAVGCEALAHLVYLRVNEMVDKQTEGRVWVDSVEVREHGGNSALYSLA